MKYSDTLGVTCSGLCICHCLLTPLLIASSLLGGSLLFLESEWVHRLLLVPVVILACMTMMSIYRRQTNWYLLFLAILGLGFMLSAIVFEERFGENFEQIATVLGGILLVAVHLINKRHITLAGAKP